MQSMTIASTVLALADLLSHSSAAKHSALYTHTDTHFCLPFTHTHTHCSSLTIHVCRWQTQRGELPAASSAPGHSHLQNTQSQSAHQSILQLRQDSAVTDWRESRERQRDSGQSAELNRAPPVLFSQKPSGHIPNLFTRYSIAGMCSNTIPAGSLVARDQCNTKCSRQTDKKKT